MTRASDSEREATVAHLREAAAEGRLDVEELVDRIDAGDRVVALVKVFAVGRGSGVTVERNDGMVWTVRDGRAVRLEYYGSGAAALKAAGLP